MPLAPGAEADGPSIETPVIVPVRRRTRRPWPFRRLALGLSPTPRPGLLLVLVGIGLGPHGIGVITDNVLTSLDPAVSMALATLGVLVGLDLNVRRTRDLRLLAVATVESAVTVVSVAIGAGLVLSQPPGENSWWLLALMLGVCAASSSTPTAPQPDDSRDVLQRIGDLDDVLPIVVSVAAIAWTHTAPPRVLTLLIAQVVGIALAIAAVAWLLLTQTTSQSEQRVFVVGSLLLLGGAAAHLSVSALLVGLVAGLFWNAVGGITRERVARDGRYLQHPLMVLLLVVAGARLEVAGEALTLLGAYVVFRIAGKLVGGWIASRFDRTLPPDFGFSLAAPGVIGIAIALNVFQAERGSEAATMLLLIVAAGSLALELASLLMPGPVVDRP